MYNGDNRPYGALISFSMKDAESSAKAKIEITNSNGDLIRNWETNVKGGVNRIQWNLRRNAERMPNQAKPA